MSNVTMRQRLLHVHDLRIHQCATQQQAMDVGALSIGLAAAGQVTQLSEQCAHTLGRESTPCRNGSPTNGLQGVPGRHIDVGGEGAGDGRAVCSQTAGQSPHLLLVEEGDLLLQQSAKQLAPAWQEKGCLAGSVRELHRSAAGVADPLLQQGTKKLPCRQGTGIWLLRKGASCTVLKA